MTIKEILLRKKQEILSEEENQKIAERLEKEKLLIEEQNKIPQYVQLLMEKFVAEILKNKLAIKNCQATLEFSSAENVSLKPNEHVYINSSTIEGVAKELIKEFEKNNIHTKTYRVFYYAGSTDPEMEGYGEGVYCSMEIYWN